MPSGKPKTFVVTVTLGTRRNIPYAVGIASIDGCQAAERRRPESRQLATLLMESPKDFDLAAYTVWLIRGHQTA
jgi:hypothetical protein